MKWEQTTSWIFAWIFAYCIALVSIFSLLAGFVIHSLLKVLLCRIASTEKEVSCEYGYTLHQIRLPGLKYFSICVVTLTGWSLGLSTADNSNNNIVNNNSWNNDKNNNNNDNNNNKAIKVMIKTITVLTIIPRRMILM